MGLGPYLLCAFILSVCLSHKVDTDDVEIRRSKFHFVDLAGSERAKRTGASGQRFKEVRGSSDVYKTSTTSSLTASYGAQTHIVYVEGINC